ncbi:MAG: noncanonical pyrimidine nucleotidase, YjjG family [Crocinitomicaceae bacterium]|nr:noncanonical pyrimidine nucleotidase, YjjG family [Crocinitomicaceae bacterium]|tara:strand:- start:54437 stop:55144 length:708 start_codon:yes stop_codon:yes gene_type:complete
MKNIFFDLDRTLWDFEKNSEKALMLIYKELHLEKQLKSFDSFLKTYKKINSSLWHQYGLGKIKKSELRVSRFSLTLNKFGINDNFLAKKLGDEYIKTSPYQTSLFPYAIETLKNLINDGYKLHIITNGFKEVQYIKLEKSKLINFFSVIVCSEEVGKNKPAKDVFEYAISKAKAKATESIMIGDDYLVDIIGAEKVGMKGILFNPSGRYKDDTHKWQIKSLDEIPRLIPWVQKQF